MEIKLNHLIKLVLFVLVFASCAKEGSTLSYADRPVVQAYLEPDSAVIVKVYYQKGLLDSAAYGDPFINLQINISDGTNSVLLKERAPGIYEWDDHSFVKEGKTYAMKFTCNNKLISAQTTVPVKPANYKSSDTIQVIPTVTLGITPDPFYPVTLNWNNTDSLYHMLVFRNQELYPTYIGRSFSGEIPAYTDIEQTVGQVSSYQLQQMQFRYGGHYNIALYTIAKEYNDILNSNGSTSLNLTNPSTNIVNGLGIFTSMNAAVVKVHVYRN